MKLFRENLYKLFGVYYELPKALAQCHLVKMVSGNGLKSVVTKSAVPSELAFCRTVGSVHFVRMDFSPSQNNP